MSSVLIRRLALSSATVLLLAGTSTAEIFTIDASHRGVDFTIRHLVSRMSGKFTEFSGTVEYDAAKPAATRIEATIQVASINTSNERRDGHLRGPDFFDSETHPLITFKSTKAEKQGDLLMVTGDFTMHGTTRSIILPVEVLGVGTHPRTDKPVAGFSAETTIKRSDYGVNSWTDAANVLGDEVKAVLNIEALVR